MSAFKDTIETDLNVFFNTDEMADFHKINNTSAAVIVDSSGVSSIKTNEYETAPLNTITLLVKTDEWLRVCGRKPKVDFAFDFDGLPYVITNINYELDGVHSFNITRNGM